MNPKFCVVNWSDNSVEVLKASKVLCLNEENVGSDRFWWNIKVKLGKESLRAFGVSITVMFFEHIVYLSWCEHHMRTCHNLILWTAEHDLPY